MTTTIDYSSLFATEDGYTDTWRELYDDSLDLPFNLLYILQKTILLPHDFYDIITAYFLLPSALCRIVPYLFLHGQSGSGKSTVAKIASYLHNVPINSSSDTFAGIRNSLNDRRRGVAEVPCKSNPGTRTFTTVEKNTCMVWDDISSKTFTSDVQLYNMFKFGYDKTTDKIVVSGKETGENMEFRCFCPKIFSSITPLHLDDRFKELKRRLIVIPCKRVEELDSQRLLQLGVSVDNWQGNLISLEDYDWRGFHEVYDVFWDMGRAYQFVEVKRQLKSHTKGLTSQQRAISLDLIATGVSSGLWASIDEAIARVKIYWDWFKNETEKSAGLGNLLKEFIKQEEKNARNGGTALGIPTAQLRSQIENYVLMGWLYEKPSSSSVKEIMLDLGMRLNKGYWVKN